jgi:hypothetical protein
MKIQKILNTADAIRALGDLDREKQISLPFTARIKLASNLRRLREHLDIFSAVKNELFQQYGSASAEKPDEITVKADHPEFSEFMEQNKAIHAMEREVSMEAISTAELFGPDEKDKEKNRVPVDILAVLIEAGIYIL